MRSYLLLLVFLSIANVNRHLWGQVTAVQSLEAAVRLAQSAVSTAGEDGYHTYRIPSLLVTPTGAAIARL